MPKRSTTGLKKNVKSYEESNTEGLESSQLMKIFQDELKDIYWAEKALTKALPKMIKSASSSELIHALEDHHIETENQVSRLEKVFESIEKKAVAKKCDAMEGMIKEGREIMEEYEEGAMCDAGIISAAQKIEHYKIASYGTLRQFAATLRLTEAVALLEENLSEDKSADDNLSEIAVSVVNVQAAKQEFAV